MQAILANNTNNDLNNNNNNINGDSDNNSNSSQSNINNFIINTTGTLPSSSNMLQTSTSQTTSASFKFSLLHNVRKAFNIKSHKHSSDSSKMTTSTTSSTTTTPTTPNEPGRLRENASNPAFTLPHNLPPIYSDSTSNTTNNARRQRSATIDTPSPIKFSTKSLKEHKLNEQVRIQV